MITAVHSNLHGQVAVTHPGRSVHGECGTMTFSAFVLATGRFLFSEGATRLFGPLADQDSDPGPQAIVGGRIDGVGSTRLVAMRQHPQHDRRARWVVQNSEAWGFGTFRTPNHRVEVNRHQPPRLLGRFDSMIATVHSNLLGQVAVPHAGRSAKL